MSPRCSTKNGTEQALTQSTRIAQRPRAVGTPPPFRRLADVARVALARGRRPLERHQPHISIAHARPETISDGRWTMNDGEWTTHAPLAVLVLLLRAGRAPSTGLTLVANDLHVCLRCRLSLEQSG